MEKEIEIREVGIMATLRNVTMMTALFCLLGGYIVLISSLILYGVVYVFQIALAMMFAIFLVSPLIGAMSTIVAIIYNYLVTKFGGIRITLDIRDKQ